jgi:hypothetical protein
MGLSAVRAIAFLAGLLGLKTAEVLDPHHPPTAPLRQRWITNLGLGLVNGEVLFSSVAKLGAVAALGIPPAGLVVFEVAMLACAQLEHANIRIPARLEPILWRTFVPPAMHRLHHAPNRRDTDSNFGTILTLWDSLLGTMNRREADEEPSFGIPQMRDPKALSLVLLAALPFRRSAEV